ncbi:MAG: hypothetical protein E6J78_00965, partial [Deltaproteobacteria bacterium]
MLPACALGVTTTVETVGGVAFTQILRAGSQTAPRLQSESLLHPPTTFEEKNGPLVHEAARRA